MVVVQCSGWYNSVPCTAVQAGGSMGLHVARVHCIASSRAMGGLVSRQMTHRMVILYDSSYVSCRGWGHTGDCSEELHVGRSVMENHHILVLANHCCGC